MFPFAVSHVAVHLLVVCDSLYLYYYFELFSLVVGGWVIGLLICLFVCTSRYLILLLVLRGLIGLICGLFDLGGCLLCMLSVLVGHCFGCCVVWL